MNKFIKLKDKINNLSDFKFILLSVILCMLLHCIFSLFYSILNISDSSIGGPLLDSLDSVYIIISAILIGPLIETGMLIIIVKVLRKFIKYDILNWVIVSLIFTFLHNYSIYYMTFILPGSFIFNYAYIFYKNKKLSIYWIMAIIHILCNSISILINYIIT